MSIGNEVAKLFNLSANPIDQHFLNFLCDLLKQNDIPAECESFSIAGMTWTEVKKRIQGGRAALLDMKQSQVLIQKIEALPSEVKSLNCADSLFFTDGQWWPRHHLKESLRQLIVKKAKTLDIKESAYVIAEGPYLRVLAALVVGFGFSRVYLVGLSEDDLNEQREQLKKSFVGIDWRPLEASQLTMQTVGATILISAIPLSENASLMSDLAYFNFMKNQGLVVDLETLPLENALLVEAQRAGLRTLSGYDVRVQHDYTFLQRLGFSELISFEDFTQKYREYLTKFE